MKALTHGNFKLLASHCETPVGVSLTVPDECMSVQELLDRFINGQRIPDNLFRNGVFDDESGFDSDDVEKLRHADLAERDEVVERLKGEIIAKQKLVDADQKRLKDISRQEMKDKKVLSGIILEKKNKRKGSRQGRADPGTQRRPSKGADEGSE